MYFPVVSLAASRARLVARFLAVTFAFATTAPEESRTVPLNSADATCPNALRDNTPASANVSTQHFISDIFPESPLGSPFIQQARRAPAALDARYQSTTELSSASYDS